MPYRIEMLSEALRGSLAVFLLIFVPLALWSVHRNRKNYAAKLQQVRQEYFEAYRERLPAAVAASIPRPSALPLIHAGVWAGLAAAALAFCTLAFSSFSYFPNLRSRIPDLAPGLELKTLHADF